MPTSKTPLRTPTLFDRQISQWGFRITAVSLLLIISYSLFPFKFSSSGQLSWQWFVDRFSQDELSDWKDLAEWLVDLLLYAALGYGATGLLQRYRYQLMIQGAVIVIVSASLAIFTESLQAFLPDRSPNLTDLLIGSFGGLVGYFVFQTYWFRSLKMAIAGFIGYMALTFLLSAALPPTNDFRNWDTTYPLLVGNEHTGDRPWSGSVSEIQIFNRAVSQPQIAQLLSGRALANRRSLVAAYQLKGEGNYPDLAGHLPDLAWQGTAPNTTGSEVKLDAQHWLKTTAPATYLTQKIQQAGKFTIALTAASATLSQTGPARILSLSHDVLHRNFTLGQQADALVLRFRTASTGNTGSTELPIAGVFSDTQPHRFVIVYTDTVFRVYVDQVQAVYRLTLFPVDRSLVYGGAIFIPLGLLLGLVILLSHHKPFSITVPLLVIFVLPALIFEVLLTSTGKQEFSISNGVLNLALMTGAYCSIQGLARTWRKAAAVQRAS